MLLSVYSISVADAGRGVVPRVGGGVGWVGVVGWAGESSRRD